MPFLDAPQEMAKETRQAVPAWNTLYAVRTVLSQGANVNNVHPKLNARRAYMPRVGLFAYLHEIIFI